MSIPTPNDNKKPMSLHYHVIISTKDLVDPDVLVKWLYVHKYDHVLSLEHGDNGHPHLDCFITLHKELRNDKLKPKILKLYPDIPKSELKNIKVVINKVDPDPDYGYGYTLKEVIQYLYKGKFGADDIVNPFYNVNSKLLSTTLEKCYQLRALQYYLDHEQKVKENIQKFKPKKQSNKLDDIGEACAGFVLSYLSTNSKNEQQKPDPTANIDWLVTEYFRRNVDVKDFSNYSKINKEKLTDFCRDYAYQKMYEYEGGRLLTVPPPNPLTLISDQERYENIIQSLTKFSDFEYLKKVCEAIGNQTELHMSMQ